MCGDLLCCAPMIRIDRAGRSMYGFLLSEPVRGVVAVYECGEAGCGATFTSTCDHSHSENCGDGHVCEAISWLINHHCTQAVPFVTQRLAFA